MSVVPCSDGNSDVGSGMAPQQDAAVDSNHVMALSPADPDTGPPVLRLHGAPSPASKPAPPPGLGDSPAAMDESPAAAPDGFSSPQPSAAPLQNGHLAAIPALGPFDMFGTQIQQVCAASQAVS